MKKFAILLCMILFLSSNVFAEPGLQNIFTSLFEDKKPEYTASEELTKKLESQTVNILMIGSGGCSGTIIYEDDTNHYVLTAKHCIDLTEEMYVEHKRVSYIMTSANDDLALLVIDGKIPNKTVAIIANWSLFIDDIVHHVSYPSEIIYKASGKMVRNSDDWQWYDFKVIRGCSGGGIFNEDGELSAVVWGGFLSAKEKAPRKSVAEPLNDIKAFLSLVLPEAL